MSIHYNNDSHAGSFLCVVCSLIHAILQQLLAVSTAQETPWVLGSCEIVGFIDSAKFPPPAMSYAAKLTVIISELMASSTNRWLPLAWFACWLLLAPFRLSSQIRSGRRTVVFASIMCTTAVALARGHVPLGHRQTCLTRPIVALRTAAIVLSFCRLVSHA